MRRFIFIIVAFITLLVPLAHVFSQTSTEGKDTVDKRLWGVWSLETVKMITDKDLIRNHIFNWRDNVKYNVRYDLNSDGEVGVVDMLAARTLLGFKVKYYSDTNEWVEEY